MESCTVAEAVEASESVTWTTKLVVPPFPPGVPEMIPLPDASCRPAGSAPEVTLQLNGGVPYEAPRVAEYGVPIDPPGKEVVTIVSGSTRSVANPDSCPPQVSEYVYVPK